MTLSEMANQAGRLWGRHALQQVHRCYDRRCETFQLSVFGVRHLRAAAQRPCLVVANHVLIRPEDTMVSLLLPPRLPAREWLTRNHHLLLFYAPPDSFILRRIVHEETGLPLRVVSISNLGKWSKRAPIRLLQAEVSHPFANGLRESLGYLPLEHTGRSHRAFLQSVDGAVRQGQPVLIFPGKVVWAAPWHSRDTLLDGGISPGAAHLAAKYGLTILPAHISGGDSWRTGQQARVTFGPAFRCDGMTKAEAGREMVARVRDLGADNLEDGNSGIESTKRRRPQSAVHLGGV